MPFLQPFFASFSWKKFTVSKNFWLLVLKCLKFKHSEVFCVIEVPPFGPSLRGSLNNCQTSRGLTVSVMTKKKTKTKKKQKKNRLHCNNRKWKDSAKPRYTVNGVPLTKNSLRASLVARNNSLLRLHWRPTLCGSKKQNKNTR